MANFRSLNYYQIKFQLGVFKTHAILGK